MHSIPKDDTPILDDVSFEGTSVSVAVALLNARTIASGYEVILVTQPNVEMDNNVVHSNEAVICMATFISNIQARASALPALNLHLKKTSLYNVVEYIGEISGLKVSKNGKKITLGLDSHGICREYKYMDQEKALHRFDKVWCATTEMNWFQNLYHPNCVVKDLYTRGRVIFVGPADEQEKFRREVKQWAAIWK
jgi:hypothetical protein